MDIVSKLDKAYKSDQELHRNLLLIQLSSLKYLTRQGLTIRGDTELESNLIQLLKTRSEDVPKLKNWIENGHYLSADIVNEFIGNMGNNILRSLLKDICNNSGTWIDRG